MNYILSNIFFGQPKLSKYQIEWFEEYFIPLLLKKKQEEDKIIITGNIFYNTTTINFSLLLKIKQIFEKMSIIPIEIVGNEYCFNIVENFSTNITKHESKFFDGIKSQLFSSKDNIEPVGFNVIKEGIIKFVENKRSPKFVKYDIKSMDDVENIILNKDFVELIVDGELMEIPEFKNKFDIFLSKNQIDNVFYTEVSKKSNIIVKNNNIREVIMDNINEELKEDMLNIFKLCNIK